MSEELKPCPFCDAPDIGDGMFMHSATCALKYIEARESVPDWAWNERHIPEGYALVPVEPDISTAWKMMVAGAEVMGLKEDDNPTFDKKQKAQQVVAAMIAAAQEPPK